MSSTDRKRAYEGAAATDGSSAKKLKSDTTAPGAGNANANGTKANGAPGGMSAADLIAQKRAEIAAKHAAMMQKNPGLASLVPSATSRQGPTLAAPQPKIPIVLASLPSKVVYAATPSPSLGAGATVSSGPTPATPAGGGKPPTISDDLVRRVAEAKRRVADAQSKLATKDNPYITLAQRRPASNPTPSSSKPSTPLSLQAQQPQQQGAGLKMAAHPLLLDTTPAAPQSKKDRYKPMQPKFASIKANVRNQAPAAPVQAPTPVNRGAGGMINPYSNFGVGAGVGSGSGTPTPGGAGTPTPGPGAGQAQADAGILFDGAPRERQGRKFHFNPKGKYVALGNQMRQEAQLEALKQRIAESARKAGMDGELGVERGVKRAPPPEAEWWDASLLPSKSYNDLTTRGLSSLNIRTPDSPITIYIQHPIPIPSPDDRDDNGKGKIELKPMMLTKKEQKKMRKLRRKGELQDKRDRIRMGLLPPDPPKVRLANLMKVLTTDAIQDPTRVEARVRREVAMRRHTHEKMNAERKLTDEQRREKLETKKAEEDRRGVVGVVFRINNLSDPSHQFKVRKNADQLNLTGLCIFNPTFNLVYVEGAAKYIRNYKRLMLQRILWTEAARPRGGEDVEIDEGSDEDAEEGEKAKGGEKDAANDAAKEKEKEKTQEEKQKSLENNRCVLIWEGALRDREFSAFKARSCPTDREAREVLGERLRGYWDVAKGWRDEDEDGF